MLGVALGNAAHRNVEWIELIVPWAVLERHGEIAFGGAELALVHVIHRQLLVVTRVSIVPKDNQIAKKTELLPQSRGPVHACDYRLHKLVRIHGQPSIQPWAAVVFSLQHAG